jgi:lysophospholipid acyltransferase (LPLAT)-like uncharacterized protein
LRRALRWRAIPGLEWAAIHVLPAFYTGYMGFVWRTSEVSVEGLEAATGALDEAGGIVALLWHEDMALAYYAWARLGFQPHVLVNPSFAGDISAAIARRCNYTVFRGGATSGQRRRRPSSIRQLIDHMQTHHGVVYGIAVDGSKGPRYRLKRGPLGIARECNMPITLVRLTPSRCLRLPTWDRTAIPLPFGRIRIDLDAPHRVPVEAKSRPELMRVAHEIEGHLIDLATASLQALDRPIPTALVRRPDA